MQNAGEMRGGQTVADAGQEFEDLWRGTVFGPRPVAQRPAIHELGDDVLLAIEFADVEHGEDVRMVERRGGLRFEQKAAARGIISQFLREKLDRNGAVQPRVLAQEDLPHPAFAEDGFDGVRTKPLTGLEIHGALCSLYADGRAGRPRTGSASETDPLQQILKARVCPQRIEPRLHGKRLQVMVAQAIRSLERAERLLTFAQRRLKDG